MVAWAIATGLDPVVGPTIHVFSSCRLQRRCKDMDGLAKPSHDDKA